MLRSWFGFQPGPYVGLNIDPDRRYYRSSRRQPFLYIFFRG